MTRIHARLDELPDYRRALVRLVGPDTARFVQGTLTADVSGADPRVAIPAALCTAKGKIVTEVVALRRAEEVIDLLVPAAEADALASTLDRHIIMDQVAIERPPDPALAIVWSDSEDPRELLDPPNDVEHYHARHPGPGQLWVGSAAALSAALTDVPAVDAHGWARRRIRTATPAWGREIVADTFPPEVGFVYAVSYEKGCFLGQEPLARIHARGQVNRVMVRVRASAAIDEGSELASDDREQAGRATTIAPDDDAWIGLAIVRRSVAASGTVLRTADGNAVEVSSGPLGDDPGVGSRGRATTLKLGRRG